VLPIAVILVVAVALVLFRVYGSMGRIIQSGIEKYGSRITQSRVTLNGVDLNVSEGQATLNGLTIGNPKGYSTPYAIKLDKISVKLDVKSLTRNPVVIEQVLVDAPQVTYELSGKGSNIDALSRNINSYVGRGGSKSKSEGGHRLLIKDLVIRNGKVSVSASELKGKTLTSPLPEVHLTDIGKGQGGATPGEVASRIMGKLKAGAGTAVAGLHLGKLLGGAGSTLQQGATDAGKKLKSLFGNH
jgi:uncharacterized protein involved in outer membrane biogenesis